MKSWEGYIEHVLKELRQFRLPTIEIALLGALVLMCLISAIDSMTGRDVGNYEQLRTVKLQAQQEMMALRTNHGQ